MNTRDVTPFATSIVVRQSPKTLYQEFEVRFAGWSEIETGATWDIFGTYDPSNPRAECLIRNGVVPPDRERYVELELGGVPTLEVRGYSRIWLGLRRAPLDTIVVLPGDGVGHSVKAALEQHGGAVGRYRVWSYVETMHEAVERLAAEAGFRVDIRLPNYDIGPHVFDPESSYWASILELVEPFAPDVWYRESTNTIAIVDPVASRYLVGNTLQVSPDVIGGVRSFPVRRRRVRRVIVTVPRCR